MKSITIQNIKKSPGALCGFTFIVGTLLLGAIMTDYNSCSQTVSEIGKVGSPLQLPYTVMMYIVSLLGLAFSYQLWQFTQAHVLSKVPVIFIASFALLDAGFAIFPAPEPMHNIVGLLHLFGYFSPLVITILWQRYFLAHKITHYSALTFLFIVVFLVLNISPMFSPNLYPLEYYGVMQRGLLYSYYTWLAWLSVTITKHKQAI